MKKQLPLAQYHVPISITISCGSKFWGFVGRRSLAQTHCVHKFLGIGQVRVGVTSTKVLLLSKPTTPPFSKLLIQDNRLSLKN